MAPVSMGFPDTPEVRAQGREELGLHVATLAARLDRSDWLAGDYSLADICYAPLATIANGVGLSAEISALPAVAGWLDRLRQRPAIQAAMGPLLG